MAKILVIDDEESYCTWLGRILAAAGHEVHTKRTARGGIELGARLRPDLLVVDWMLKDDLNGLHVAWALRTIDPSLEAILVTGYPAQDLEGYAREAHVAAILRKPFELAELRGAIEKALATHTPAPPAIVGVLEVAEDGRILYANPCARELMQETTAGPDAGTLAEVLDGGLSCVDSAAGEWTECCVRAPQPLKWRIRAQQRATLGSRLLVIAEDRDLDAPLLEVVLGVTEPVAAPMSVGGRVLVVDDSRLHRMVQVALLEHAGVGAYAAASHEEALRLLEGDPGVRVAVLDFDMPDGDIGALVTELRERHRDLTLIGNSSNDRRAEFAARGVTRFIPKPWRPVDLRRALAEPG